MSQSLPDWAIWSFKPARGAWTVGVEEEVMLLDPSDWRLAQSIDSLLPALSPQLASSVSAETHACTLVPAVEQLAAAFEACAEHAAVLDCQAELEVAAMLATRTGAEHQRELASSGGLEGVLPELSNAFLDQASRAGGAANLMAAPRR
jgi:hypothetical protein